MGKALCAAVVDWERDWRVPELWALHVGIDKPQAECFARRLLRRRRWRRGLGWRRRRWWPNNASIAVCQDGVNLDVIATSAVLDAAMALFYPCQHLGLDYVPL